MHLGHLPSDARTLIYRVIHPSAWKGNSANFAITDSRKFAPGFGRWHHALRWTSVRRTTDGEHSSAKIFPDLAHLDDTRRHISGYTGRRRSTGERLGKGGVKDLALAEELRESFYQESAAKELQSVQSNRSITLGGEGGYICLLYTSPSPRDRQKSRMPSSA